MNVCWIYEKNPRCPNCRSIFTWRKGLRRGAVKYQCRSCSTWFQINRVAKKISSKTLLVEHLSGISFRTLGQLHDCGATTAYRKVEKGLQELPSCIDVTRWYCQQFQGVLLVDGKYVSVKKHDRKIPVLYGIDYQTHDIPHYRLSYAEDYANCKKFFTSLKLTSYVLQAVVCDDNSNIYKAAQYAYPNVVVQLCHLHFLRNMRSLLDLETSKLHRLFFQLLCRLLITKRSKEDFEKKATYLFHEFASEPTCNGILIELARKQPLLQGYLSHKGTPTTTNLIESFNSHLEARLGPLKGFESIQHADLWLNGYFLQRRTRPFVDCQKKFRRLNGKTALSQTKKPGIELPNFFT